MPTLGCVEIVRYKAIVEEISQARIPKIQISTTTGAAAPDGHLRHSKFVGLKDDKEAREVLRERF